MAAFIGLNLLAGLHKSNHGPISSLCSEKEGRPIYTATMSRNGFTGTFENILGLIYSSNS